LLCLWSGVVWEVEIKGRGRRQVITPCAVVVVVVVCFFFFSPFFLSFRYCQWGRWVEATTGREQGHWVCSYSHLCRFFCLFSFSSVSSLSRRLPTATSLRALRWSSNSRRSSCFTCNVLSLSLSLLYNVHRFISSALPIHVCCWIQVPEHGRAGVWISLLLCSKRSTVFFSNSFAALKGFLHFLLCCHMSEIFMT